MSADREKSVPRPGTEPTTSLSELDKLKVQVLLKEYDTLRQEILGRLNNRFALVSFGTGLSVFIASRTLSWRDWILVGVWLSLVLCLWWRIGVLMLRCSSRIAEIEKRVNEIVGDRLLLWESSLGGGWLKVLSSGRPRPTQDRTK